MPRRLAIRLLIAWLAWIPLASAQGPGPQGPSGPGFPGMSQAGGPYAGPAGPSGYQLQPSLYEQLLPASRTSYYDPDALVDLGIGETLSRSWLRTEYLYMTYRDPGSQFLGATPLVVPPATFDPNAFFQAQDQNGARAGVLGRLVSLRGADNRGLNGLRMTVGIPTQLFTWETSGFGIGQSVNKLSNPTFQDVNSQQLLIVIPAIPVTRDGVPSDKDFILFDQGLDVRISSNLQAVDSKLVFGAFTPNLATEVAPILGFNYVHFGNQMLIRGNDSGINGTTNTAHRVDSRANNNIFGPELGLRMETRSKWVTLGFEPKFTFGINRISNHLSTHQLVTSTVDEPDLAAKGTLTRFAPVIELGTYARFRLAEHVSLSIGYQFMAMPSVSFSQDNVVWNTSVVPTTLPLLGLSQNRNNFWAHGANVGIQWQF